MSGGGGGGMSGGVSGECLQAECSEKVGIGVNGAVNGGGRRGGGSQQR